MPKNDPSRFSAVIFDFDGVITDTEPVHFAAWKSVLHEEGLNLEEAEYRNYVGLNDRDFLAAVERVHNRSFGMDQKMALIGRKLKKSLELLEKNIPVYESTVALIKKLSGRIPLAICSGSIRDEISFVLEKLGLKPLFSLIISGDEVKIGKPNPTGYLSAVKALNLIKRMDAHDCLAIEDSPKGVTAAKSAGMKCLALTTAYRADELKDADWFTNGLEHLPEDVLSGLGLTK